MKERKCLPRFVACVILLYIDIVDDHARRLYVYNSKLYYNSGMITMCMVP